MLAKLSNAFLQQGDAFSGQPILTEQSTSPQPQELYITGKILSNVIPAEIDRIDSQQRTLADKIRNDINNLEKPDLSAPTTRPYQNPLATAFKLILPIKDLYFLSIERDAAEKAQTTVKALLEKAGISDNQIGTTSSFTQELIKICNTDPSQSQETCSNLVPVGPSQVCRKTSKDCKETVKFLGNLLDQLSSDPQSFASRYQQSKPKEPSKG